MERIKFVECYSRHFKLSIVLNLNFFSDIAAAVLFVTSLFFWATSDFGTVTASRTSLSKLGLEGMLNVSEISSDSKESFYVETF